MPQVVTFPAGSVQSASTWLSNYGPRLLLAFLVIAGGYLFSKLFTKFLFKPLTKRLQKPSLVKTTARGIEYVIVLISVIVALAVVGIRLTGLLLSATVLSVVIGIVMAPIVTNFIYGAFLLKESPYEVGDMIQLPDIGKTGFVREVTITHTTIITLENTFLAVPNQRMRERDVVNYTAGDLMVRREKTFTVSYESDLEKALEVAEGTARGTDGVIAEEGEFRLMSADYPLGPVAFVKEFAESGIEIDLLYWIERPYKMRAVDSEVSRKLFRKLRENDIHIPYPHRHVVFNGEPT